MRKTICVDFDGVLHSYTSGWKGAGVISDPPVEGAMGWLLEMTGAFDVRIYSSRSKNPLGWWAMRRWIRREMLDYLGSLGNQELEVHLNSLSMSLADTIEPWDTIINDTVDLVMSKIRFPIIKPAAWMTIDDRAFCFEGKFPYRVEIESFRPWNKRL